MESVVLVDHLTAAFSLLAFLSSYLLSSSSSLELAIEIIASSVFRGSTYTSRFNCMQSTALLAFCIPCFLSCSLPCYFMVYTKCYTDIALGFVGSSSFHCILNDG